jgi:hypothetical protein
MIIMIGVRGHADIDLNKTGAARLAFDQCISGERHGRGSRAAGRHQNAGIPSHEIYARGRPLRTYHRRDGRHTTAPAHAPERG